jgi:hypothetical protein
MAGRCSSRMPAVLFERVRIAFEDTRSERKFGRQIP